MKPQPHHRDSKSGAFTITIVNRLIQHLANIFIDSYKNKIYTKDYIC